MNYSALIEGRRSVRAFLDKAVPEELILEILEYHDKSCKRLAPDIDMRCSFWTKARNPPSRARRAISNSS